MRALKLIAFALIPAAGLLIAGEVVSRLLIRNTDFRSAVIGAFTDNVDGFEDAFLQNKDFAVEPDPYSGYRTRPTAPQSRRPPQLPLPPRRPGEVRVVVIGDSVAYGWGNEESESWPAKAQEYLDDGAPAGTSFVVYNAAVPGHNAQQCKRLLQSRYLADPPDIVLWHEHPDTHDTLDLPAVLSARAMRVRLFLDRSRLLQVLRVARLMAIGLHEPETALFETGPAPIREIEAVPFSEFVSWCRDRGVGAFAGVEYLIHRERAGANERLAGNAARWEKTGVPYVPLRGAFQGAGLPLQDLYADTHHFTAEGSGLAARRVSAYLLDRWPEWGAR